MKKHPKDFEILWVCTDCGTTSIYHFDIEEHKRMNYNHRVAEFDLDTGKVLTHFTQHETDLGR